LYTTSDPAQRESAEAALRGFSSSSEFIPQCQLVLEHSSSPYSLHLASSSLLKLYTLFATTFTAQQTVDIRTNCFGLNQMISVFLLI
jgi:hypothetical protein